MLCEVDSFQTLLKHTRVPSKYKKSIFSRRNIKVYFGEPINKTTKADELATIIQNMKDKYEIK